jgi:hypothetical protein
MTTQQSCDCRRKKRWLRNHIKNFNCLTAGILPTQITIHWNGYMPNSHWKRWQYLMLSAATPKHTSPAAEGNSVYPSQLCLQKWSFIKNKFNSEFVIKHAPKKKTEWGSTLLNWWLGLSITEMWFTLYCQVWRHLCWLFLCHLLRTQTMDYKYVW